MGNLMQDLRYGLRGLLRQPVFTLVAVVSLALGIGANTAIFSLVNAVLLKPLEFSEPDQLVVVWEVAPEIGFPLGDVAVANYADWKAQNKVFDDMAALSFHSFNITGDGEPEKLSLVVLVCGGLFIKSFRNALKVDPGFAARGVLLVSLNPELVGYNEEQTKNFFNRIVERAGSLPGVQAASVARLVPLSDSSNSSGPILKRAKLWRRAAPAATS